LSAAPGGGRGAVALGPRGCFNGPPGGQPIEKVMIGKRLVENDVDRVVLIGDALIGNAEIENWMIG
jgi:hypothetical protein